MPPTPEIWISAFSLNSWIDENSWRRFLSTCQETMRATLVKLDVNDPIRRRAESIEDSAAYICALGTSDSRWVLGTFSNKVSIEIIVAARHTGASNALTMTFPSRKGAFDLNDIGSVFEAINTLLNPFYSYSDLQEHITAKKKPAGAVDLETELVGMFWLTYFNRSYRDFIGREKFQPLNLKDYSSGGVSVRLGEDPTHLDGLTRQNAEHRVGRKVFVDPQGEGFKRRGEHALRFEQLRREMNEP